jgi:hypothetical protein
MNMRTFLKPFALALALVAFLIAPSAPALAQAAAPVPVSISASASSNTTDQSCVLVKYRGTTAGKPTVEVAAGGDVTFKIAGSADTTTGSSAGAPSSDGIFDLSTPNAVVDTMGEFVNLVNTTGSNWVAVLTGCLASDLTDNTITTISATDASTPKGVELTRDAAVASATSIFSAQVALLPDDAASNIAFFVSGSPVGAPRGSTKVNPNPFANYQAFIQHIRENITSTGTIALNEILAVKRTYDDNGKVSESVRTLYSITGAATTVEGQYSFHAGPIVAAPGELIIVRQRTGTGLTASQIAGNGYMVRR